MITFNDELHEEIVALIRSGNPVERGNGFALYGPLEAHKDFFVRVYEGVPSFRTDGVPELPIEGGVDGKTVTLTTG